MFIGNKAKLISVVDPKISISLIIFGV